MGDWVKVRRSRCRKGRRLLRAPLFQASFHFQGPFLFLFSEAGVENASKGLIWMVLSEGVAGMSVYFWSVYCLGRQAHHLRQFHLCGPDEHFAPQGFLRWATTQLFFGHGCISFQRASPLRN